MAEKPEAGAAEAPKRSRWKRFVEAGFPLHAATAVAAVLVAVIVVLLVIRITDPIRVPVLRVWNPIRSAEVLLLTIVIPVLTYYVLKLWHDGPTDVEHPAIDQAWRAGCDALAREGIRLDETPLFLVLGAGDRERSLFAASGREFRVDSAPRGAAPLHWFADSSAVYLSLTDCSALAGATLNPPSNREGSYVNPSLAVAVSGTPAARSAPAAASAIRTAPPAAAPASSAGGATTYRGTVTADEFAQAAAPESEVAAHRGTATFEPQQEGAPEAASAPAASTPAASASATRSLPVEVAAPESRSTAVSSQDLQLRRRQLRHVCQLLRRERRRLCGTNGVLATAPFAMLSADPQQAVGLERALRSDLAIIHEELGLRCPTTLLVIGMEQEPGFRELIRRVGADRAMRQRFGRRFELNSVAAADRLGAFCVYVCDVFEDWIYSLFREEKALTHPGNTRLFGLLCKIRSRVKGRLAELMTGGVGWQPETAEGSKPVLFSGCYFAAAGDTPDRQAFVGSVLDKLQEEQEFVEWLPEALRREDRLSWMFHVGLVVAAVMVGLLFWQISRMAG